jgi:hypothetical protein
MSYWFRGLTEGLSDLEGRAEVFHAEGRHPLLKIIGPPSGAVLPIEELFHTTCGSVSDEESSGRFPDEGEGVRHVARAKDGVAGFEVMQLVAHLDDVFAVEDVEPLVFDGMEVKRWTAFFRVVVFHGEEVATTIFGGDFEGGGSVGERPLDAITISIGRDGRYGRGWSGDCGGSSNRGLEGAGEEAGRKCGSKELKKRAAFEWGHRSLLKGMRVSIDLKGLVAGEISETVRASLECPTLAASRRRWNTHACMICLDKEGATDAEGRCSLKGK